MVTLPLPICLRSQVLSSSLLAGTLLAINTRAAAMTPRVGGVRSESVRGKQAQRAVAAPRCDICSGKNMRTPIKRTGFSKRRFRRRTLFPLVAVVQKRAKPQYHDPNNNTDLSTTKPQATSSRGRRTAKRSRGSIDYKNVVLLRKLITTEGKILPRRINKLSAKQQRYTCNAIKSARIMGLLPFINWSRSRNL